MQVYDINQFMQDAEVPSPASFEQRMDPPINGEVTVDHERLRYVTRLLGSQQGLNTALLGALVFWVNVKDTRDWP